MNKKKFASEFKRIMLASVLPVIFSGIVRAIGIYFFSTPNQFAPGGFTGIAVLLEILVPQINSGYWLLILHIPLFFVAFFFVGKREAVIATASIIMSSILVIIMDLPKIDAVFSKLQYKPTYGLLAAIAAGIFFGLSMVLMIRSCGTSGGTTIIATIVNKKYSNFSISGMTSVFDGVVVIASFFVFNQGASFTEKLDPVFMSFVMLFVTSKVCDGILHGFKTAYKFEIITTDPEAIAKEIMTKLNHGVTKINAEGMYSGEGKSMLICIIRKRHFAELQRIIHSHPDTFASFSAVNEVYGKFTK